MSTAEQGSGAGVIVLLNGAPRSGKSSLATALQSSVGVPMMNLGVDSTMACTPVDLLPGIGLRPGGERPDLEGFVRCSYRALFDSIAAHARHGIGVVSDLGIHDGYSQPLGIWQEAAERLDGLSVHVVGVRCSIEQILERRAAEPARYQVASGGRLPEAISRWQEAVHLPGWYDLEVDTSRSSPGDGAAALRAHLATTRPTALDRHRRIP